MKKNEKVGIIDVNVSKLKYIIFNIMMRKLIVVEIFLKYCLKLMCVVGFIVGVDDIEDIV